MQFVQFRERVPGPRDSGGYHEYECSDNTPPLTFDRLASCQPRNPVYLKLIEVPLLLRDVPTLDFCLGEQCCLVEKRREPLETTW